ncbi:MAG: ABC transporter permease subunit [Rhodospirillaceae bacterium]|nr:ABC transporter permease subunit [Rhodospirillaceae bacterium]MYB13915.1 ABC transporter permease subunit [Rhodospirillaceae bacterium]MYI50165.1 ABC transporter permease subunit [Rhodospirillaceae bacterium]
MCWTCSSPWRPTPMADAAVLGGAVPVRRWVAGSGQSGLRVAVLLLAPFVFVLAVSPWLPDWLRMVPKDWSAPFVGWINAVVEVLRREEIFGLLTFRDITRAIADLIDYPLDFVEAILVAGFSDSVPGLPWIAVTGLAIVLGWYLQGRQLGIVAGICFAYMAIFGKWELSMVTLSVVLVAAPIAGAIGVALGVLAYKRRWFETLLWPILNVMQALPHFSYMIPVAIFIGIGHKAGTIATIIFAFPVMARLTILGLKGVSPEVREAGIMAGCTKRQMLWKVELPAARPTLMVGVNQIIMLCLAMVVLASFVGAKGLGHDLLNRLRSLWIGQALEIGVVIVFMAIILDRLSQAWAEKEPEHAREGPFHVRHPFATAGIAVVVISYVLAAFIPALQLWPKSLSVTTAPMWDAMIDAIVVHAFDYLELIKDTLLVHVLIPMRDLYLLLPWSALLVFAVTLGWYYGGWQVAVIQALFALYLAFAGFWERTLITAYMVSFAVIVCVIIGSIVGVWAAAGPRRTKVVELILDTFQTFPSFIYLIPAIMLFNVNDFAAIMAIVIYATIPTTRLTIFGLRTVPHDIVEAAIASGCTPRQVLWKVRMPLAFPAIMLGINQTIMYALFMVVIAAFIGTTDLGQEIFRSKAENDAGKSLVVGLCVAFMGLMADQLINAWARERKKVLGLE